MTPAPPPLAELLDLLPDLVCVVAPDGTLLYVSAAFERVLGHRREDVLGRPIFELIHPDDRDSTRQQAERVMYGDAQGHFRNRYMHRQGQHVELLWSAQWLPQYGVRIGIAREIGELRRIEQDLEHRANHDPLTGLANRRRLHDALESALVDAVQDNTCLALLYVDLDGFKHINDRHGHAAGDAALVDVARRMRRALRQGDLIARIGGDEFVALLPGCDAASAQVIADALHAQLHIPLTLDSQPVHLGASTGIACYPADGTRASELLAHADRAMYAAKHTPRHSGGSQ